MRHEAGGVRPRGERDADHLVGRRHLEVERHRQLPQRRDVGIADMPAVLAQMRRDPVGLSHEEWRVVQHQQTPRILAPAVDEGR